MAELASIGGATLVVDSASSADVVAGVESAVVNTFAGIVGLMIISERNGERPKRVQSTVEYIMNSVAASAVDYAETWCQKGNGTH